MNYRQVGQRENSKREIVFPAFSLSELKPVKCLFFSNFDHLYVCGFISSIRDLAFYVLKRKKHNFHMAYKRKRHTKCRPKRKRGNSRLTKCDLSLSVICFLLFLSCHGMRQTSHREKLCKYILCHGSN